MIEYLDTITKEITEARARVLADRLSANSGLAWTSSGSVVTGPPEAFIVEYGTPTQIPNPVIFSTVRQFR